MRITTLTTPLGTDPFGSDILSFRRLEGVEALNHPFEYTLMAHSANPNIAARDLLGKAVSITIEDQFNTPRYLNAIVKEFTNLGDDHRRSLYEMKLVPWLSLATLSADCRIYQKVNVVDIVTQVLGKYPFPIKQLLLDSYDAIPYCVQYNESDYDFCSRLLERFGIGYYFEHSADSHTLVLTDRMTVFTPIAEHESLSYTDPQNDHIGAEDTFSKVIPQQRIKSGSYTTSDYDYRQPYANLEEEGTGTYPPKGHPFERLPVYHWPGQGHYKDWDIGESIAVLNQDQQQQQFQVVEAQGAVRALVTGATGHTFTLIDHPSQELNQEYLILAAHTSIQESAGSTGDADIVTEWDVKLTLGASKYQYRPQHVTKLPRIPGPQSAVVVGPAGQEIWTTDLGEVFVRFFWDRYASGDQNSSCAIRVCSTWAGDNWGSEYLPRIGTEVIVSYLDGNPDYPIIIGRVVNSSKPPPTFSNTGALPGNQALAGIKSRELQGGRYNQFLMDDTTGEIRVQVESEHAKTQLNMGYLVHPRDVSAVPRGEGAEMRTDTWGVLRAAKGILFSTNGQHAAVGNALSRDDLVACLEAALSLAKDLDKCANDNLANATDASVREGLNHAAEDWGHGSNAEPDGGGGGLPIFAVSALAGIALTTPKSTSIATGQNIDLVAQKNQHLTAAWQMNLHAAKGISHYSDDGGIKSIAHKGKNIIQAQNDNVAIAASQNVIVNANQAAILVAAKEHVTLTSGGGYIKIADGNIDIHCPGTIDMKASNYNYSGPTSMVVEFPFTPKSGKYSNRLDVYDLFVNHEFGEVSYQTKFNGTLLSGSLDEHGRTQQIFSEKTAKIKTLVGTQRDEWDAHIVFKNADADADDDDQNDDDS